MKVIVLSGISGAGKSTRVKKLKERFVVVVVSADDYFMKDGVYQFNPKELTQAHAACFKSFLEAIQESDPTVEYLVVDNTNLSVEEISPYMLAAAAYGLEAEIQTVVVQLSVAASRNVHGVPMTSSQNQWNKLQSRRLPPWWKQTSV